MTISQFSISKRSPLHSSSKINERLEAKKKLLWKKSSGVKTAPKKINEGLEAKKKLCWKKPSGLKTAPQKAISHAPKRSISQSERAKTIHPHDSMQRFQTKSSAMERAEVVQSNLPAEFPSFVKLMLPSHVAGGFWLSFPKSFSNLNLPMHDDTVILVDESEGQYKTKYLVEKSGLSAGWRGFSIAHKLLEGDVLVFQLVRPCKFKVYIVRASGLTELDGAIGLFTLDTCVNPADADKDVRICEWEEKKRPAPVSLDIHQYHAQGQENGMVVSNTDHVPKAEQSGNESDYFGSEVLEGIRFSESSIDFKDVKSIENFTILIDGLIIDSEIPPHLRTKYYELCCCQKSFLHDHLLKGLNCKLAAGIISETVNIADAIRASKLTTSRDNFTIWNKTLKGFEELGMNVGFLRDRLDRLVSLAFESEKSLDSKRLERVEREEEIRTLEAKLLQAKEVKKNLDEEIEGLEGNSKALEVAFQEEANAPW